MASVSTRNDTSFFPSPRTDRLDLLVGQQILVTDIDMLTQLASEEFQKCRVSNPEVANNILL